MKKATAIFLSVIMIFALCSPAFAADTFEEYPTIYVTGAQTNDIYSADGEMVSDFDFDLEAVLDEHGKNLLSEFAIGMLSDNYDSINGLNNPFVGCRWINGINVKLT